MGGPGGAIIITFIYSIVLPIGLLIWWKKRSGASLWCFIAGAICFMLFAMTLESLLHAVMLSGNNSVSKAILGSPALYTLYGALAAGLFEETGRLFGFRVLLKKHEENECAVAYGIGHGGIEVLMLLGLNYLFFILVQMGLQFGTEAATSQLLETANTITWPTAGLAMFERISAMMLHIGLSMIMFAACRRPGRMWLYPFAILLHALADAPAALYQRQAISSLAIVEVNAFVLGLICLFIGRKVLSQKEEGGGLKNDTDY